MLCWLIIHFPGGNILSYLFCPLECGILLVTNFSFKKYTKFSGSD